MTDDRNIIVVTIRWMDGEPLLDAEGMALLYGATADEIRSHMTSDDHDPTKLPLELRKQGRRRAREAMAHTSIDSVQSALEYWADREYDSDIQIRLVDE